LSSANAVPSLERSVSYLTQRHLGDLSQEFFSGLVEGVRRESHLLHPPASDLAVSFNAREAIVALDEDYDRVIGYVRLEPLLTARLRTILQLSQEFPNVYEAGTMFVDPDPSCRGRGHLQKMCAGLLGEYSDELKVGEMLVLGTTKDIRVLKALDDG